MYKEFKSITEALWSQLTEDEKRILTKYTQTYHYLNERLRGQMYLGPVPRSEFDHDLPILTDILNRCSMPRNIVVRRGVDNYMIPELSKYLGQLKPGDEFIEGGFLSTAMHRSKGFLSCDYEFKIVVPKGSKGVFAEPYSYYNDYCMQYDYRKRIWNGSDIQEIGNEFEWHGQRGSKFRVIKKEGNTIYLEMIGQMYEVIDLNKIVL